MYTHEDELFNLLADIGNLIQFNYVMTHLFSILLTIFG